MNVNNILSEDDKMRIRAEEIYRAEVQHSIERPKSFLQRLNQPIVLWFLSSVVLAGAVWSYDRVQEKANADRYKRERTRKLLVELQYRFRSFYELKAYAHVISTSREDGFGRASVAFLRFQEAVGNLLGTGDSMLTDLGERSALSLIWEMTTLEVEDSRWDRVLIAALELRRIVDLDPN